MNKIKLSLLAAIVAFGFTATASAYESISTNEFHKITQKLSADSVILDVRTKAEVKRGYIKGMVNKNFHDEDFAAYAEGLDRSKTYYIYCHSGGRSGSAAGVMSKMKKKFKKIVNVDGGMKSWKANAFPVEK